jgi:ABC-type transport system substrate-binding protein
LNRIYLLFPELGFTTTYFVSINDLVIEQCADEIAALPIPKFIAWHSNRHFQRFPDDMVFLYTTYTGPQFAYDMTRRVWEGATVTNVALQLAFYMGFEPFNLYAMLHSKFDIPSTLNLCGINDGTLDIALEGMYNGVTRAEALKYAHEAQSRLSELIPYIPVYSMLKIAATTKGLVGLTKLRRSRHSQHIHLRQHSHID